MLEINPATPTIGAEIRGLDLCKPCDAALAALEKAWIEHKVLFFRDQQHLTTDQHVAFCRQLGELDIHPFAPPKPGHPEVMLVLAKMERVTICGDRPR